MTATPRAIRVAVPVPLAGGFDYLPDSSGCIPAVGARVRVPFGRRRLVGIVTAVGVQPAIATARLRRVTEVIDQQPLVDAELLALVAWMSDYYHHPIGEVHAAVLPVLLRRGVAAERRPRYCWQVTAQGRATTTADLGRARRQAAVLAHIAAHEQGVEDAALHAAFQRVGPILKRLVERGLVAAHELRESMPAPGAAPELNAEQLAALQQLGTTAQFAPGLLEGVTGSGKTEIYLALAQQVVAAGRQALILVPEIGLTPQLVERFSRRLGARLAVLHSGLGARARCDAWLAARAGEAAVVLGTRSAVLTPLAAPGLIVVDEEHDGSYKQQDGLRYHARDVAVRRAQMAGIPVVLGSATPSLESLHNAGIGRYRHARLTRRAGAAVRPALELLDVRGKALADGLSAPLLARLREHLDAGGQGLIFLNRRGYAPALVCHDCGWVAPCARCDTGMALHRGGAHLRCHHCGASAGAPSQCPACGSANLIAAGEGTERIAAALRARFADVPMARFDRDTTARKGSLEAQLARVRSGETRLLVGTQMLAKGHDFPELSFVGVVNADHGLFSADFRAFERMAQLVTQVAGRAGRAQRRGEVLLQTRHPEHPLLQLLTRDGYPAFAQAALAERRGAGLPPFGYLALLRAQSPHARAPMGFLEEAAAAAAARTVPGVELWGPVPAPMERLAGRYRGQLLLRAASRSSLHRLLRDWVTELAGLQAARQVRYSLDVDPQDLL